MISEQAPRLPIRIRREDLETLPPLERILAEHLIKTQPGRVFVLVDDEGAGP